MQHIPIVVMGVSGSGKSTVGVGVARALDALFVDADDLHPASNVAKMRSGIPLDDEDRLPWLRDVGRTIRDSCAGGRQVVVACSALRRRYRDIIRYEVEGRVVFVHLVADASVLEAWMGTRAEHFMPASLLGSQLATLEQLESDELGYQVAADSVVEAVADAVHGLALRGIACPVGRPVDEIGAQPASRAREM